MDDLEGYRQAQAAEWQQHGQHRHPFELEQLLQPFQDGRVAGRKPLLAAAGSGCCLLLMMLSIGTLTPLQYGLTMNLITRQIDPENVYEGGRHLIGPYKSFVSFPSTRVTLSFTNKKDSTQGPLTTRTKDGLELTLQLAFQYRIDNHHLGQLFALANLNYEPLFIQKARDVLLKAAADYDAPQYWEEREKIGLEMQSLLNKRLQGVYAHCDGLQILVIELPQEYEASIVNTQVTEQMQKTKQNEQAASRIDADTQVMKASYTRNVTVTKNGADAQYTQDIGIAKAAAQQQLLEVEASALAKVKQDLGLTAEQTVAYQEYIAYHNLDNASFLFGLGNALVTVPTMN